MKNLKHLFTLLIIAVVFTSNAQEKTIALTNNFDKIIVSPHIEANFVKGTTPNIQIESMMETMDKFQYEVANGTLQVYLEGAKTYTKHEKTYRNGYKSKKPLYKNTVARLTITYVDVETFSVRGEEKITFESPLEQEKCVLRIYGASEVAIKDAKLDNLRVAIYGESDLMIASGSIKKQRITAYGSSNVRSADVESSETKITSYGDGTFQFNVSDKLKITSYGEANILYKGNPDIKKGIVIGESTISRI